MIFVFKWKVGSIHSFIHSIIHWNIIDKRPRHWVHAWAGNLTCFFFPLILTFVMDLVNLCQLPRGTNLEILEYISEDFPRLGLFPLYASAHSLLDPLGFFCWLSFLMYLNFVTGLQIAFLSHSLDRWEVLLWFGLLWGWCVSHLCLSTSLGGVLIKSCIYDFTWCPDCFNRLNVFQIDKLEDGVLNMQNDRTGSPYGLE